MPLPQWMIAQVAHPLPPLSTARLHVLGIGGRGLAPLAAAAAKHSAPTSRAATRAGTPTLRALLTDAGIRSPVGARPARTSTTGAPRGDRAGARARPEIAAAAAAGRLHRRMDLTAAVLAARDGLGVTAATARAPLRRSPPARRARRASTR